MKKSLAPSRVPMRLRKLVGAVLLLVLIAAYALLVAGLVATVLPRLPPFGELVFYAAAGLAWTIPAGLLIRWMQRPDVDQAA